LNNYLTANPIFVQYQIAASYTETYEPSHFARIEPYALEHAKSEADRASNLANYNTTNGISDNCNFNIGDIVAGNQYTLGIKLLSGIDSGFSIINITDDSGYYGGKIPASGFITFVANTSGILYFNGYHKTGVYQLMLVKGSHPLPYQPYEGKTVHETGLTKSAVGLSNVDNTADKDKPVSTATQAALDGKQNTLTIDTALSDTSANPIANSAVSKAIGGLAKVATSGSYNDLSDKPTIDSALSETSTNAVQNSVATQAIKKAQGVTIKVLGNTTDFFNSLLLNQYTSPVHSTVIKFELKNAVSLSLQSTYGFAKPILTKAVLVKYGSDYEKRYPLVISGLSKRLRGSTSDDSDDYETFSISETLYNNLTGASDITGTSNWYFLFTFEEME
jgi:hypothetical protein